MIAEAIFWLGGVLLVYTYFGYPLAITMIARRVGVRFAPRRRPGYLPRVTVIVPAHNEEAVIARKIACVRGLSYGGEIEIIVASDGSTDATAHAAAAALGDAGILLDFKERRGKTAIINDAVSVATGEILVFTDANVMLAGDAVARIVGPFADASVGCVQGQLSYTNASESHNAGNGGLYWRYEEAIKQAESDTGSLMGADGSLFAVRRSLFRPLPLHVLDDFCTSMGTLAQGFRIVFEPDARAFERSTVHSLEEFRRKIRIANRSMTSFLYLLPSLRALGAVDRVKLFSHRVLRWASGFVMIAVLAANLAMVASGVRGGAEGLYGWTLAAQILFYGGALGVLAVRTAGGPVLRALSIPGFFLITVAATTVGVARGLAGTRVPFWSQMETTR